MKDKQQLLGDLAEKREERAAEIVKMREIVNRSEIELRDLSPNEQEAFDRIKGKAENLSSQIAVIERQLADTSIEKREPRKIGFGADRATETRGMVLGREQRMKDWVATRGFSPVADLETEELEQFSLGKAIRAMSTGDWNGAEIEQRALSTTVNASGGFMTPEVLSARFIDLVRDRSRVLQAGATTVPLASDQQSMPKITGRGAAAWRNENTAVFESEPTIDRVTFTPRTLARTMLLSFELAEDMLPESAARIDQAIADSLAFEVDRVSLRGTGTAPEPKGVRNHTGVEIQTTMGANGATPTNFDPLVKAVAGVRKDGFDPTAVIYSARTEETLGLLKDTTNQPLQRPRMLQNVTEYVTNSIPDTLTLGTSSDTSEVYAGQWDELLIGFRSTLGVRFVRETKGDTLQYRITAYLRADVQVAHGEAFAVVPGFRP